MFCFTSDLIILVVYLLIKERYLFMIKPYSNKIKRRWSLFIIFKLVSGNQIPPTIIIAWILDNLLVFIYDGSCVVIVKENWIIITFYHLAVYFRTMWVEELFLITEVLRVLHSDHQGVIAMNKQAKTIVYWPGVTNAIQGSPENCNSCNLIASSNPRQLQLNYWSQKFLLN